MENSSTRNNRGQQETPLARLKAAQARLRAKQDSMRDASRSSRTPTGSDSGFNNNNSRFNGSPKNRNEVQPRVLNSSLNNRPNPNPTAIITSGNGTQSDKIQPAQKFKKYIDYDFSKMTDTKGGFIADEVNNAGGQTLEEWKLKQLDMGPVMSMNPADNPKCFECDSSDIDQKLFQAFKCRICKICREKIPEKYSLLTKTECRADYLLTDPELRDEDLLPHIERPNPHQSTYSNMMLYLRYQVEEYAFKKWDGEEGLDAEYERRVDAKKKRRDKKFLDKLKLMRKKTRAETLTRKTDSEGPHIHDWSTETLLNAGMIRRRCVLCGMETEEISF